MGREGIEHGVLGKDEGDMVAKGENSAPTCTKSTDNRNRCLNSPIPQVKEKFYESDASTSAASGRL
ncbi:hypothetical protein MiSe_75800 [Microseira wollei NIES-4236]|uniref:Uncharacterized protein n=1 Tax=Microseira wollei NIES-4236 TaxID=2530354 RepID=A0AAV3XSE6_9CYAN|nr:hypothetical protein MiSe_75800 [Microseira wollei NIES-4236]